MVEEKGSAWLNGQGKGIGNREDKGHWESGAPREDDLPSWFSQGPGPSIKLWSSLVLFNDISSSLSSWHMVGLQFPNPWSWVWLSDLFGPMKPIGTRTGRGTKWVEVTCVTSTWTSWRAIVWLPTMPTTATMTDHAPYCEVPISLCPWVLACGERSPADLWWSKHEWGISLCC